jgi:heme exporter protein B
MKGLMALLRREFSLAFGGGGGPLLALSFYACLIALLPLAAGRNPEQLAVLGSDIAWLALALASLLSLERLFERDYEDGTLDLLAMGPVPLEAVALIKALAQFLSIGAPLALASPIGAIALGAPVSLAPMTVLTGLLGGLSFAFVGGLGAALALGAKRGGLLVAVVVLPLFVPPVIFGAAALDAARLGDSPLTALMLLAAYAAAAAGLTPIAMAAACRNALD